MGTCGGGGDTSTARTSAQRRRNVGGGGGGAPGAPRPLSPGGVEVDEHHGVLLHERLEAPGVELLGIPPLELGERIGAGAVSSLSPWLGLRGGVGGRDERSEEGWWWGGGVEGGPTHVPVHPDNLVARRRRRRRIREALVEGLLNGDLLRGWAAAAAEGALESICREFHLSPATHTGERAGARAGKAGARARVPPRAQAGRGGPAAAAWRAGAPRA